jgi:hypothetical protein
MFKSLTFTGSKIFCGIFGSGSVSIHLACRRAVWRCALGTVAERVVPRLMLDSPRYGIRS